MREAYIRQWTADDDEYMQTVIKLILSHFWRLKDVRNQCIWQ